MCVQVRGHVAAGRAWERVCDHQDSLGQAVFILCVLVTGLGKLDVTLKRLLVTTRILLEMEKVDFRADIKF